MKKKKKNETPGIVVDRKCDVPMAEKKHFLPCEGGTKCFGCVACMEQDQNGEWHHCDPLRGVANRSSIPEVKW